MVWCDCDEFVFDWICGSNYAFTEDFKGEIMRKRYSDKTKLIFVFAVLLVLSFLADATTQHQIQDGYINRNEIGEEEKQIELELGIEGMIDDYEYSLEVSPVLPTQETAEHYFAEAISDITKDFQELENRVPVKESYVDGAVEAEWQFVPYGIVDAEGNVCSKEMDSEEEIIQAQVELHCGNYEKIHTFSFLLSKPKLTEEEYLLAELEKQMEQQMQIENSSKLKLPEQIEGRKVSWKEKTEYITPKILLLEIAAGGLCWMFVKKKKEEEIKKRQAKMEQVYPDLVSQLALLLGAGMTMRQAWMQIAKFYKWKRDAGVMQSDIVYEAILRMSHKLAEGESERIVYQRFSEEITAAVYRKLMRILLGGLEKGSQDLALRLQEESKSAFEQRILSAKKQGEEASTKMLLPLMIMMGIVMAIVMLPALLEFQI